jgi:ribosomal protein L29
MKDNLAPKFMWDKETGVSTCILTDGKSVYLGTAKCKDADRDMMNEKTGCEIAFIRAEIEYFKKLRDNELTPALNALKGVLFTLEHSNESNDYSKKVIQRQIHKIKNDLAVVRYLKAEREQTLTDYIAAKTDFYNRVRKNREQGKNN